MLKTFALILAVLNPTGERSTFVVDYSLTAADCHALALNWQATVDQFSLVYCSQENGG